MREQGLTLIETLIYTALIGIVLSGFVSFALLISGIKNKNYAIWEVNNNSRLAINLICQKIRQASAIISPPKQASSSVLVLEMPDNSQLLISVSDGFLILSEDGVETNISGAKVEIIDLVFLNLSQPGQNDNIKISFVARHKNNSSIDFDYEQSFKTAVSLRR